MSLTICEIIGLVIVALSGIFLAFVVSAGNENFVFGAISLFVTLILVVGLAVGMNWYNTSTASGIRGYKDYQSEMSNGIEREITITAEDGREIFHYEGKVDVESNHVDNYIKFESEDGKRYIVYYGIQDTITIIEK